MDFYPLHEITRDYDDFTADELTAMRESLRAHGILVPIVVWRDQIVDGRHRFNIACDLGIELRYEDITERCPTEDDMRAHVRALNQHRRSKTDPLTNAEKRERTEAALKMHPELSNRQIAEMVGVSHTFVSEVRKELEDAGDVATVATRTDSIGRQQQAHKPKPEPPPPPPDPPASRPDPTRPSADAAHKRAEREARAAQPPPPDPKPAPVRPPPVAGGPVIEHYAKRLRGMIDTARGELSPDEMPTLFVALRQVLDDADKR